MQVKDLIKYLTERLSSKEGIKQLFEEAKYSIVTIVGMPFRIWAMMRQLLKEGCFVIETNYAYEGEEFSIRTFIQPDADIITIIGIPRMDEMPVSELTMDEKKAHTLMVEYKKHNRKVVNAFEELDGRLNFWGGAIDLTTLAVNTYPLYQAFVEQTQEGVILAGVVGVASLLFRQFAKKKAIELIVSTLFKLASKYFKFM